MPVSDYAFLQYGALGLLAVVIIAGLLGAGWFVRHTLQEQAKRDADTREERGRFLETLQGFNETMFALKMSIEAHEERAGRQFETLMKEHGELKKGHEEIDKKVSR